MSRRTVPVTVGDIESVVPANRILRRFDGGGLYLEILPTGRKLWRLKYRIGGREKKLSFGAYPAVSIGEARERREAAKKLLAQGIDPSVVRREQKARATGDRLAQEDASRIHVAFALDGEVEIWKGRAVVSLKLDEAQAVKGLLTKLFA